MFFFFNDTATTEIYTLSLHDALPIYDVAVSRIAFTATGAVAGGESRPISPAVTPATASFTLAVPDRKSTRLNSSHLVISYAVFCLKKKKEQHTAYIKLHRNLQHRLVP